MDDNYKKTEKEKTNSPKGKFNLPNKPKFNIYWVYGILALAFIGLQFTGGKSFKETDKTVTWNQLTKMIAKKDVEKIAIINKESAEVYIKKESVANDTTYKNIKPEGFTSSFNGETFYIYKFITLETFQIDLKEIQEKIKFQDTINKTDFEKQQIMNRDSIPLISESRRDWGSEIFSFIWPFLILLVLWLVIMRMMGRGGAGGGQIFNIGKSKAQLFDKDTSVTINFHDVAGLEEAKTEIIEIVDFLKNPIKYTELGGKIPKGALLVGPPGTGKTLLAKAVAGEAKVPFFSISGSDFVEMFVGVGASRVRDLFKQAKEKAPCIIFIDEIDAIGRARGKNAVTGGNDERENTLNQLLTEMDGFATNAGVIILAATNRADILDKALMRAGRFDRQIYVELPDLEERKAIFTVHMRNLKYDKEIVVDFLAKQTPGFSGADIANVCNESALIAARKGKKLIEKQDFLDAIDRIVGGLEKRNKIISLDEKKVIAFHEAGHASISWLLEHAHPLVKVTIVPRGKALGAAWYLPEERQITTSEQMLDEITATLGGRAAEHIAFGRISTGALNDLEKVTKQAYAMVAYFGLNEKIGNVSYYDSTGQSEYSFSKPFSEKTAEKIDFEISNLIETAYQRAIKLLSENRDKLDNLAQVLIDKEVIFREDLELIFGKRPYDKDKDMDMLYRNIPSIPITTKSDKENSEAPALAENKANEEAQK
jgi:cell division protease FtsH